MRSCETCRYGVCRKGKLVRCKYTNDWYEGLYLADARSKCIEKGYRFWVNSYISVKVRIRIATDVMNHWYENYLLALAGQLRSESRIDWHRCALCKTFGRSCAGCPIGNSCSYTPWEKVDLVYYEDNSERIRAVERFVLYLESKMDKWCNERERA